MSDSKVKTVKYPRRVTHNLLQAAIKRTRPDEDTSVPLFKKEDLYRDRVSATMH